MKASKTVSAFLVVVVFLIAHLSFGADANSISLDELGFKKNETQSNTELQLQLEKRTSMLKTHQVLALITVVPMVAQFFLGGGAAHDSGKRDIHMVVGIATAALYATSASFAILAPKPDGIKDKGSTKIHKALAWVHGPLMVIAPVLGAMAYKQANAGEKVQGIASLHGAASVALLTTYLASAGVMTFNF